MHRHQWIIFLPNFILSRFYVTLYLLSYCVFHFNWCRVYTYICIYMRIYLCVYIYMFMCLRMHVTMYTWLYVCFLCVLILCMLILWCFFYLWLLGQRWPNKEVETNTYWHWFTIQNKQTKKQCYNFLSQTHITVHQGHETLVLYQGKLKMTKFRSYLILILYFEKQDNGNNNSYNKNNDNNNNNANHNYNNNGYKQWLWWF